MPADGRRAAAARARHRRAGARSPRSARGAIARGEIAAVVLAGGMATRFGSQVKALAPVLDGRDLSFLDLKLADLTRLGVDVTLMTSFATHDALAEAVADTGVAAGPAARVAAPRRRTARSSSTTRASPRRTRRATATSADALELSGALERYRRSGVRTLFVCNVDNVGATLDPALAGLHRELGGAITAELVSKRPGDVGGLPVRRADGSLAIAEAFRVPEGFPHERFPLFNTNTLWIDVAGARGARPSTPGASRASAWTTARRSSSSGSSASSRGGTPRATSTCPREGAESRFVPVKDEDDLAAAQEQIAAICRERLGLDV